LEVVALAAVVVVRLCGEILLGIIGLRGGAVGLGAGLLGTAAGLADGMGKVAAELGVGVGEVI